MRAFLSLFLVGMVSTTFALFPRQDGYPQCSYGCLANATSTQCQPGEVKCLCEDPAFINSTTTCFEQSCSGADLAQAEQTARDTCALAGVTLSSTPPSTTSPTSGATAAGSSSSTTSPPSSPSSKPNSAGSTMVNIIGVAASLGLAALAL